MATAKWQWKATKRKQEKLHIVYIHHISGLPTPLLRKTNITFVFYFPHETKNNAEKNFGFQILIFSICFNTKSGFKFQPLYHP